MDIKLTGERTPVIARIIEKDMRESKREESSSILVLVLVYFLNTVIKH